MSFSMQDNLFEWHFSVRGPPDSDFDGGVYHGRIVLPPEYPMKPPSIILLTVRHWQRPRLNCIRLFCCWSGTEICQIIWSKSRKWTACHLTLSHFWLQHTKWQLSDQSLGCHHTVGGNCTGFVGIWDCLSLFRQLYDTFTNDSLMKARVLWFVVTYTFWLHPGTFSLFSFIMFLFQHLLFEKSYFCKILACVLLFSTLNCFKFPCQSAC